jgi:hypothetical protein
VRVYAVLPLAGGPQQYRDDGLCAAIDHDRATAALVDASAGWVGRTAAVCLFRCSDTTQDLSLVEAELPHAGPGMGGELDPYPLPQAFCGPLPAAGPCWGGHRPAFFRKSSTAPPLHSP